MPIRCTSPYPPRSTSDLRPSELSLALALRHLAFGRMEGLQIEHGDIILDPWPTTVQSVKFGAESTGLQSQSAIFELKKQVTEFFDFVRNTEKATVRWLEVRHGLPFSMEVEYSHSHKGET